MPYRKLEGGSLKATRVSSLDELLIDDQVAGAYYFEREAEGEGKGYWGHISFVCPCGCGHYIRLQVGKGEKPAGVHPTWKWNGDEEKPTLEPSIDNRDNWHGWLQEGVWKQA